MSDETHPELSSSQISKAIETARERKSRKGGGGREAEY